MKKNINNILILLSILFLFINVYISLIFLIILLVSYNMRSNQKENKQLQKNQNVEFAEYKKIEEQTKLFNTKKEILTQIIDNEFGKTSITSIKFFNIISNVEKLFNKNVEDIKLKLQVLDIDTIIKTRNINDKTFLDIKKILSNNDEIINKMDKLIIEIGKLDSLSNVEKLYSMEELERLTENIKLYRGN